MASELKTIWRHSRVYGFGNLLNRVAAFLLIPVLVHFLPAEEWGVYALILVVVQVIIVVPGGLTDTLVRLYFDHTDEAGQNKVIATTFGMTLLLAIPIAAVAYPLALGFSELMLGNQDYSIAFFIANLGVMFELLFSVELRYYRVRKRSFFFICATLTRSLLQFGLSIFFAVALNMGVTGIVLGNLAAVAIVSLVIAGQILPRTGVGLEASVVRSILSLGLPLMPAWFARALLPFLERSMLNLIAGTTTLGVFALGSQVSRQLQTLLSGPFNLVWDVRLMEVANEPDRIAEFHRVLVFFLFILTTVALGLSLMASEVVMLISAPEYWGAAVVVPFLALTNIFYSVNFHFEAGLIQRKKTGYLPLINWSTLGVSAAALYGLITHFGMVGAAGAVLLAQVFRLAVSVYCSARCSDYPRLFPWLPFALIVSLAIGAFAVATALAGSEVSVARIGLKALIVVVFVVIVFFSPALKRDERRAAMMSLRKVVAWVRRSREPS